MRLRRCVGLVVAGFALLGVLGTASASAATPMFANLTGAQETGGGDPNGSAAGLVNLTPSTGQVCVAQRHAGIDAPTLMHIHAGAQGVAGPIVVDLTPTLSGPACVTSTMPIVRDIVLNPQNYYLNIHNGSFSNGAVRGQLVKSLVGSAMPTTHGPGHLFGRMSGSQEVPGPGDADGRGSVFIDLMPGAGKVCVDERYARIAAPAELMHIHSGAVGVSGPIVVNLTSALASPHGCVTAPKATIQQIRNSPRSFYCNIHNDPFPNGAIRGQLRQSQ